MMLRSYSPSLPDDAHNNYLRSIPLKLLLNTEKDKILLEFEIGNKNTFRLDFLHPFFMLHAFVIFFD